MLRGGHERAIGGGQAVISLALAPRAALLCIKHTRMVYSWTELLNTTKHHKSCPHLLHLLICDDGQLRGNVGHGAPAHGRVKKQSMVTETAAGQKCASRLCKPADAGAGQQAGGEATQHTQPALLRHVRLLVGCISKTKCLRMPS